MSHCASDRARRLCGSPSGGLLRLRGAPSGQRHPDWHAEPRHRRGSSSQGRLRAFFLYAAWPVASRMDAKVGRTCLQTVKLGVAGHGFTTGCELASFGFGRTAATLIARTWLHHGQCTLRTGGIADFVTRPCLESWAQIGRTRDHSLITTVSRHTNGAAATEQAGLKAVVNVQRRSLGETAAWARWTGIGLQGESFPGSSGLSRHSASHSRHSGPDRPELDQQPDWNGRFATWLGSSTGPRRHRGLAEERQ